MFVETEESQGISKTEEKRMGELTAGKKEVAGLGSVQSDGSGVQGCEGSLLEKREERIGVRKRREGETRRSQRGEIGLTMIPRYPPAVWHPADSVNSL